MIIAITDSSQMKNRDQFAKRVLDLIESPVKYVILREKTWDADTHVNFLLELMGKSDLTCRKIVVHSHVTVARHLGLTYVHLPENRIVEEQKSHTRYAYSLHTLEQLAKVNERPSLFNLISPIAQPSCKPDAIPLQEAVIKEALIQSKAPLVALGGITPEVAKGLREMGFQHLALMSALMSEQSVHDILAPYLELGFNG